MSLSDRFDHDLRRFRFAFYRPGRKLWRIARCSGFKWKNPMMWLLVVSAFFTLVGLQLAVARASFITAPTYPAGPFNAFFVAVGDFNGDGILDLAVTNLTDSEVSTLSILLGKGDGTFQGPKSYVIGPSAYLVAVGDFNGDGHPDLAVTGTDNFGNRTVNILLGNGDGTFQAPQTYVLRPGAWSVAVADLNGDGVPDLVVGGGNILLGNGDGTFQPPQKYDPPGSSVVVGDFNGDGIPDLAVANGAPFGTVSVLLGNGDGTFQPAQSYAAGYDVKLVVVGDFNGDGILDLAVAYYGNFFGRFVPAGISILLGNGDGTFQAAHSYTLDSITESLITLTVGDVNGDGRLDLIVAGTAVSVLLGKGDGTFQAPVLYAAGGGPRSIALGDFNGDGVPDLAVASGNTVSILLGKGDGTFQAARSYGPMGSSLVVADFNRDGIPDVAVANAWTKNVSILLGNGDGTFQPAQSYAVADFPISVAAGDFNGDGIPDLAVVNGNPSGDGTVSIFLGNGDGTFQPAHTMPAGGGPNSVAVGDFNGDGKLDIVTTNFLVVGDPRHPPPQYIENGVRVFLGNGDGSFQAAQPHAIHPPGSGASFVAVGDFNGDGIPDLAVAKGATNNVSILLGNGDGTFHDGPPSYSGSSPALADLNGDGFLDMVVAKNHSTNTVTVLLGNGDGTFQPAQEYAVGTPPNSVAVGDFNHDGIPDLAVADGYGVSILLGNGDGTFQARQSYAAGPGGIVAAADFNGDGFPDVVFAGDVTVLINAADW